MNVPCAYSMPFGAQLMAAEQTRFRLWAPDAESVAVDIANRAPTPMEREPEHDGWFSASIACGAGTCYLYRIATKAGHVLKVPDPASRLQQGDIHDASVVVDPAAYVWRHQAWRGRPWHETVIYELHVGLLGGFAGVTGRLAALAELGITAVELMPIADFPGSRNWGYDGVLPFAPDAAYGTPEELKALIDTAHGLGMMVFLDVIYNHFGPEGNYLGSYASAFFRNDLEVPWGQAFDFRRREVGDFFIHNALYWIHEYRIDGLRLDAVHAISEQSWPAEFAARVRAGVAPERHVHLMLEHEGNAARFLGEGSGKFNAQWNDDGHHVLHALLTGERESYYGDYAEQPAAKLARCLKEGFVYQGEPSRHLGGRHRGEPSTHLEPSAFILFLQNHDQIGNRAFGERLVSLAPVEALRCASAVVLLSPQIPLLFMGEECGAAQPFLYFTSHASQELADAVRDGRRREFAKFSAFSDAHDVPDPNALSTFSHSRPACVSALTAGDDTAGPWQAWTKALLALRHAHIMPRLGGAHAVAAVELGPAAAAARWKMGDGRHLTIALNFSDAPAAVAHTAICNPAGSDLLFETEDTLRYLSSGTLPAFGFIALLESA